ncbi:hypothetical protein C8Q80DRAFT_1219858 [Daedaleopsis nitida]|nr:hypothetical protein C8Q80DRAFT_1219858 [Daedaleopsis nitida]
MDRHPLVLRRSTGEVVATLVALQSAPYQVVMIEETDSETTMDALTKWRCSHEDQEYATQRNGKLVRATVAALRLRKVRTYFRWIKGHNGHPRNEGANKLAGDRARKAVADEIDRSIPESLNVSGCKLSKISQRLAYQIIWEKKERSVQPHRSTVANVTRIIEGIRACLGVELSEAQLWKSIRNFLWMLRDSLSEELRQCAVCRRSPRGDVEETWSLTKKKWMDPCWGNTVGIGCATFLTSNGKRDTAMEALWITLASESLYLIWKLHCKHVIQNEGEELSI